MSRLWMLPSHWLLSVLSWPLIGWAVHIEPERPSYQQNSVFLSRSILRHSSGTWTKKQIFKISKRKKKKHTLTVLFKFSLKNLKAFLFAGLSSISLARISTVLSLLTSWLTWVFATLIRGANWTMRTRRRQVTSSNVPHALNVGCLPDYSCWQQYNQCSLITFGKLSFICWVLIGQYRNIWTLIGHTGLPVPDFHCHKVLTFCHFLLSAIKRQFPACHWSAQITWLCAGLWLAADDLIKISENHSQLLRPSYTPKSHDYGIDRVSDE